jgi:hypothetical protein
MFAFVGYVYSMVIDDCLLKPLSEAIFLEKIVDALSRDTVSQIVGQSDAEARMRQGYKGEIRNIDTSLARLSPFWRSDS